MTKLLEWLGIVFFACLLWVKVYVPLSRDLSQSWSRIGQGLGEIGK